LGLLSLALSSKEEREHLGGRVGKPVTVHTTEEAFRRIART
jgi:hypothetical protein